MIAIIIRHNPEHIRMTWHVFYHEVIPDYEIVVRTGKDFHNRKGDFSLFSQPTLTNP